MGLLESALSTSIELFILVLSKTVGGKLQASSQGPYNYLIMPQHLSFECKCLMAPVMII